jgi:hypothetical protein
MIVFGFFTVLIEIQGTVQTNYYRSSQGITELPTRVVQKQTVNLRATKRVNHHD